MNDIRSSDSFEQRGDEIEITLDSRIPQSYSRPIRHSWNRSANAPEKPHKRSGDRSLPNDGIRNQNKVDT